MHISIPTYKIFVDKVFDKELRKSIKIHKDILKYYEKAITTLSIYPLNLSKAHDIKKLNGVKMWQGEWRIRIGNYRLRYDVKNLNVHLFSINHRKDIYK
ncbi:MAG: type II toxin-antitoxin system RelE/ParE family toxin [bacterium]|nr:type II toxin-antitoxin system RelE/ParE family toxin [bacterium]